ncbi:MAG: methyltransferase domain-containing protein [Promethearchaeota archaeon]
MAKYIFILGTNWRLSLAEINNVIEKPPYEGRIADYSASAAIVEFENEKIKDENFARLIFRLGGTQKIGKYLDFVDLRTLQSAFPEEVTSDQSIQIRQRKQIARTLKDLAYPIYGKIQPLKYFFANSIYGITFQKPYYKTLVQHFLPFVNKEWMKILKSKGAKNALYYRYPEDRIRKGTLNPLFPHHFFAYKLYEEIRKEILYTMTEEGLYIGYTINVSNSNEIKKIDENRPYKDAKSSIPPKFAKIMIELLNLNQPLASNRILDPFCGSGTILMFAHTQGIQTYGLDIDPSRINGTKKNLKWISKILENPRKTPAQNYQVGDISKLSQQFEGKKFEGIISEPFLLPFYRELPRYNDVAPIMEKTVIPSYTALFTEGFKVLKPNRRIVVTAPSVETIDGGRFRMDLEGMARQYGFDSIPIYSEKYIAEKSDQDLQLYSDNNSLYDDKSEVIRREFHVFEKVVI